MATLAALIAFVQARPAGTAWPHFHDVNVPVVVESGDQSGPRSVPDGHGGMLVAWSDARSGAGYSTYLQHVDSLGTPRWTPGGVGLTNTTDIYRPPVLIADGMGGVIVGWLDLGADPSNPRLYLQRIDALGVQQWSGGGPSGGVPVSAAGGTHYAPTLVEDGGGGAIAFWSDSRLALPTLDLYAQRIDAAGHVAWDPNGVAICTATGTQHAGSAIPDGSGGAIVPWFDTRAGFAADIYVQRIDALGSPQWQSNGVPICTASGDQFEQEICSDGASGAIVAWSDHRAGLPDIYAQRVSPGGSVLWTSNGVALCTADDMQQHPRIVDDGAGGGIVVWQDDRFGGGSNTNIYARRISAAGAPLGAGNGTPICLSSGLQVEPRICTDGAGGAIIVWQDERYMDGADVFAQRLDAAGVVKWMPNGVVISRAPGPQLTPSLIADDQGGAIVAWADYRDGCFDPKCMEGDVYAQRVERSGNLGNPEPIVNFVDVPEDQGGALDVVWAASYLDSVFTHAIGDYQVFRSQGPDPSWNLAATVPATQALSYSVRLSSAGIASPSSTPRVRVQVIARSTDSPTTNFYASRVDSGVSIDNIPPPAPTPLDGQYASGTTTLDWDAVAAPDVLHYRIYRATDPNFVPGPSTSVGTSTTTAFLDSPGTPFIYRVTALDTHGNEGPYATWALPGTVDSGTPDASFEFALVTPSPNPSRGAASFGLTLPRETWARLALYDVGGRERARIHDGILSAGPHQFRFDPGTGRDALPSGVYLVRLTALGRSLTRRWAVIR